MIHSLLAAVTLLVADGSPAAQPLSEAAHALEAGRVQQARTMIATAVKAGAEGPAVDRLLADLAFASGDFAGALGRYRLLLVSNRLEPKLYESAGVAALKIRDITQAQRLLAKATSFPGASWRAWNARAAAADWQRDWDEADAAYAKAMALAPQRAEVLNNMGWSKLVRGEWREAAALLERAVELDPKAQRVRDNLELAQAAITEALPERRAGESDTDWAARLNDAGVIAGLQGNHKKAIAAFAQAIDARSQWFERAANNLKLAESDR